MDKNTFPKVAQVVLIALALAVRLMGQFEPFAAPLKLDSLKVDGVIEPYTNTTVTLESRFVAVIKHDKGISRVKSIDLPEEVKAKLGLLAPIPEKTGPEELSIRDMSQEDPKFLAILEWVRKLERKGSLKSVKIAQTIGEGILLATNPDSTKTYVIVGDKKDRADGDIFNVYLEDTGKMYDYVTVLGANSKVRIYAVKYPMTVDEFVTSLKAGKKYTINGQDLFPATAATEVCDKCKGQPIKCLKCNSTGRIEVKKVILVKW